MRPKPSISLRVLHYGEMGYYCVL